MIWATEDQFAEEVIEEMASFPFGEHDDFCDSSTMALMRIRQGGFIDLNNDYQDDFSLDRKQITYY
jgi:phage terminase large subunit-like protein